MKSEKTTKADEQDSDTSSQKTQPKRSQILRDRLRTKLDSLPPHKQAALLQRAMEHCLPKWRKGSSDSEKNK